VTGVKRTVLVVDDEASLRRVLERALERVGYEVISVGSAETAYQLLATKLPDAVLLDIRLPTMSGLALYLAIVHRWPALTGRLAIMTGNAEAEEVRTWLERNPCPLLHKPFDLQEIFNWLAAVVEVGERESQNG
jgi:DNA-binding NtrC family response regulator